MAILPEVLDQLALKFEVVLPHLNERQRRLLLAAEARVLGVLTTEVGNGDTGG